jgi:hypothetical protein
MVSRWYARLEDPWFNNGQAIRYAFTLVLKSTPIKKRHNVALFYVQIEGLVMLETLSNGSASLL